MQLADLRKQWEGAAPGWVRWESTIAEWMEPATEAMLDMAGVEVGSHVLDLACGAGSQTLRAAQRVGPDGHVLASDISAKMLRHVQETTHAAGLTNVSTLAGAAEELELASESFDAVICRLGLMLFSEPAKALNTARQALKPHGKIAVVVFTTPEANPFLAKPMQILLSHAGKTPPAPRQPGIFALGAPGVIEGLFTSSGFTDIEQRTMAVDFRMPSAEFAVAMMQEAMGAYRAIVSDCPDDVRVTAWSEVAQTLKSFETTTELIAPAEVLVAAGLKRA